MNGSWRGVGVCAALLQMWACGGDDRPITSLPDGEGGNPSAAGAGGAGGVAVAGAGGDLGIAGAGGAAGHEAAGSGAGSRETGAGGEGGRSPGDVTPALEIAGTYEDDWGITHAIDDETWDQGDAGRFEILEFDNDTGVVIAHNAEDNAFNPGTYSRFDWTRFDDELWYCQTVYDAESAEAARDAEAADATDPSTSGCGGFAWSRLTPL
jgi:hypothetical protein